MMFSLFDIVRCLYCSFLFLTLKRLSLNFNFVCIDEASSDVEVITQSFSSRYELISCIVKLEFIKQYDNGAFG